MTTIRDIAVKTGVSIATVSRVLHGYPDVHETTRQKVQKAIAELGYSPGALSRSQMVARSYAIGVFYFAGKHGELTHPFFQDVLDAFKQNTGEAGYDLLFFSVNSPTSDKEHFEVRSKLRRVDGLLLASVSRMDERAASLCVSQIPSMSIDFDMVGARAGYISSDNLGGARLATEYLITLGHRDIAFIGDQFNTKPGHDRLIGFQQTLQRHQLPFSPDWVLNGDFSTEGGYKAAEMLIHQPHRPTAIFCAGDLMAIGAMQAIRDAGLEVGADLSVIGFDDIAAASLVTPSLTTIRQDRRQIGQLAAKHLVAMIDNPNCVPPVVTVPTELVVRSSVKSPRK